MSIEELIPATRKESPDRFEKRGRRVWMRLSPFRHGERDGNKLIEIGRKITRENAQRDKTRTDEPKWDAIKAMGSDADVEKAGASVQTGGDFGRPWTRKVPIDTKETMGRARETAHIYARERGGEHVTRTNEQMNFKKNVLPPPHDHTKIYNAHLPPNFSELEGEEKIAASKHAQDAVVDYIFALKGEVAENFRRENAGAFAHTVLHYAEMASHLRNEYKALIVAGSHGPMIEWLLQQALVWTDDQGIELLVSR